MRLRYVAVYGLFNSYDHIIELNGEGLTFIHSLNGVGKSIALKLINSLFLGDEDALLSVPFQRMDVRFDDGTMIFVDRREGLKARISKNEVDTDTTIEEIGKMYDVLYLSPDRNIIEFEDGMIRNSIDVLVDDFNARISSAVEDMSIEIGDDLCDDMEPSDFVNKCKDIKAKMDFMSEAGFVPKLPSDIKFPPERMDYCDNRDRYRALLHSLMDWVERYYVLAESIVTYLDILNGMFTNKRVVINEHNRLSIVLFDGNNIPVNKLSAGEKQIMIMFYGLLFMTHDDMTVIIDEPEISLHVAWQQRLCNLFLNISRIRNIDILVATHSPQIIHDRWDLAQELSADHA